MIKVNAERSPAEVEQAHQLLNRLDRWLNRRNLIETLLFLINAFIALKSSANLVAYLSGSKGIIVDYDGALLLHDGFKLSFLLLNVALLASSTCSLMVVLFSPTAAKKRKLNKYLAILELLLAAVTLALLAKLWFVPLHLRLDESRWRTTIRDYTYTFSGLPPLPLSDDDSTSLAAGDVNHQVVDIGPAHLSFEPPISSSSSSLAFTGYELEVDRLQQALGCCGIWEASEWHHQNRQLGLLAPSCCAQPVPLDKIPDRLGQHGGGGAKVTSNGTAAAAMVRVRRLYCRALDQVDQLSGSGCQRLLNEREVRFTFNLRLTLLALLATLILMAFATLSFNKEQAATTLTSAPYQQPAYLRARPARLHGRRREAAALPVPAMMLTALELAREEARLVQVVRNGRRPLEASPVLTFQ